MVIEVKNLVKAYQDLIAVNHFNMLVRKGEIVGLIGPNGSGKTTVINCILGLLTYDKGEIKVFGKKMKPTSYDLKEQIGLVPQEIGVFESLTVEENIHYFASLYKFSPKDNKKLVQEALEFVEIEKYRKFLPRKLSGGLKRRLNIACGIVHGPKLLFLDEPTVAVDAQSRNFILQGIKRLKEKGVTVVYTTHYLDEAEELCDRIIIMDKGENLAEGTTDELRSSIATTEKIHLELENERKETIKEFRALPNIMDVTKNENAYRLCFGQSTNNLEELLAFLKEKKYIYSRLYTENPTLNDVFLELTGKELRE
ncbi:MAG: ABC transporter ATP-binding protein [Tissierellia bacterium]|nr:ABC transporter ATP-binding protein [Tissierellia bacterium]